jgi:hypothetical protein
VEDIEEESLPQDLEKEVEIISHSDAIQALKSLKLYELQQDQGERLNILALERFERLVSQRMDATKTQATINRYFHK